MALSSNSHLLVGGTSFGLDLSDDVGAVGSTDNANMVGVPSIGREWIEKELASYEEGITLGTLYFGDGSRALADNSEGFAFLTAQVGSEAYSDFLGGASIWRGVPSTAPDEGLLTNNVEFMASSAWFRGRARPFSLTAAASSQNFGFPITNEQTAFVVVTGISPRGTNRSLSISDGTNSESITVRGAASVIETSLSKLRSGSQTIEGWILIGTEYEVPK